jgi:hypothetical protein
MNELQEKLIANIPEHLLSFPMKLDGETLSVSFWADDEDGHFYLYLSVDEVRELEKYGVTDELIEWMRSNDMVETEAIQPLDEGEFYDCEIFRITDGIIEAFYDAEHLQMEL